MNPHCPYNCKYQSESVPQPCQTNIVDDILSFNNHSNSLFYTATYGVSATLLAKILSISNETFLATDSQIPNGVLWSLAFEPLPTQVTKYGPLKGGNSLGTTPADGNGVST